MTHSIMSADTMRGVVTVLAVLVSMAAVVWGVLQWLAAWDEEDHRINMDAVNRHLDIKKEPETWR